MLRVSFGVLSETEQPAAPETTTEGEESAPAGSENKLGSILLSRRLLWLQRESCDVWSVSSFGA